MAYNMYVCPDCRKVFKINGSGKKAKCPKCGDTLLVDTNEIEDDWKTYSPEKRQSIISDLLDEPKIIEFEENEKSNEEIRPTITEKPIVSKMPEKPQNSHSSFFDFDDSNNHDSLTSSTAKGSSLSNTVAETASSPSPSYVSNNIKQNEKHSTLSVIALILSILGFTSLIGLILGIVDLTRNKEDGQKHTLSKVSIGIFGFYTIISILLFVFIGISGIGYAKKMSDENSSLTTIIPSKEDKTKENIWSSIQPAVANELKDPDSADFCPLDDAIILEENGKYHVIGEVKGKNSFGTMISNGFEVYVTEEDGNFIPGEITFLLSGEFEARKKLYKQKQEREANGTALLSATELDSVVQTQDLYVKKTSIMRKEDMYIASGDMLQAFIYNNSDKKISSAIVAFACWDSQGLPLKIKAPYRNDGSYIVNVTFDNINLTKGQTFGEDSGYEIDEAINPQKVKAIIVSYETTDGTKWENPNYLDFVELYEGKDYQ